MHYLPIHNFVDLGVDYICEYMHNAPCLVPTSDHQSKVQPWHSIDTTVSARLNAFTIGVVSIIQYGVLFSPFYNVFCLALVCVVCRGSPPMHCTLPLSDLLEIWVKDSFPLYRQ